MEEAGLLSVERRGSAGRRTRARGAQVLVGDADPATRETLRAALIGEGHEVVVVEDVAHAHRELALNGRRFDVIIWGFDADELRGSAVERALRDPGAARALVLVSDRGRLATAAAAMRLGATAILRRPLDTVDVRRAFALGHA